MKYFKEQVPLMITLNLLFKSSFHSNKLLNKCFHLALIKAFWLEIRSACYSCVSYLVETRKKPKTLTTPSANLPVQHDILEVLQKQHFSVYKNLSQAPLFVIHFRNVTRFLLLFLCHYRSYTSLNCRESKIKNIGSAFTSLKETEQLSLTLL